MASILRFCEDPGPFLGPWRRHSDWCASKNPYLIKHFLAHCDNWSVFLFHIQTQPSKRNRLATFRPLLAEFLAGTKYLSLKICNMQISQEILIQFAQNCVQSSSFSNWHRFQWFRKCKKSPHIFCGLWLSTTVTNLHNQECI